MAGRLRITALAVGQGGGNLIEYYQEDANRKEELKGLAIIDLGTSSEQHVANVEAEIIKKVKDAMQKRANMEKKKTDKEKLKYYLDFLCISHQDKDHWSILDKIMNKIKTEAKAEKINLNNLKDFFYIEILLYRKPLKPRQYHTLLQSLILTSKKENENLFKGTDYKAEGISKRELFKGIGEIKYAILMSGADLKDYDKDSKTNESVDVNTASIILVLYYRNSTFIFPGDATYITMYAVNILGDWIMEKACTQLLLAPHHGSYVSATGCVVETPETSDGIKPEERIFRIFFKTLKPRNIVIEAGFSFGHPGKSMVEYFTGELLLGMEDVPHGICLSNCNGKPGGIKKRYYWRSGYDYKSCNVKLYTSYYGIIEKDEKEKEKEEEEKEVKLLKVPTRRRTDMLGPATKRAVLEFPPIAHHCFELKDGGTLKHTMVRAGVTSLIKQDIIMVKHKRKARDVE